MTSITFQIKTVKQFEADIHTPVVIIGAGACGLTTALNLSEHNVDCVVIERDPTPSGSTSLSSGFIPAAGTQAQHRLHIDDAPVKLAHDIQVKAHQTAAPHLVKAYTDAIAPALDFLEKEHGFEWQILTDFLYPGHHQFRMHTLNAKTGAALIHALEQACQKKEVPILTSACVTTLWVNDAYRVLGVTLERPSGEQENIGCDALMLACNGYGGNTTLVKQYIPEMSEAIFGGHTGNDGAAVQWGLLLGAELADMAAYQGHGSWASPHGILITWALMVEGGVQINAQGKRFHDESCGYSEASLAVLQQPNGVAWQVFDTPIEKLAQDFPDYRDAQGAGAVKRCETIEELALVIACQPEALHQTLASFGGIAPDPWGRQNTRPLEAPYFAIKVTGALFHTQGGLNVDAQCKTLTTQGNPLPNLWAAGGAARGVSGQHMSGYLSGNGLLSAIAGGYIAAQSIASQLGHGSSDV
jgi:fumarate reductase flavoprotein subunit